MALSNKENKLKSILSEERYDIDTDELWAGIQDSLPKEKAKRRFPLWLTIGASSSMVVALLIVGFFIKPVNVDYSSVTDDINQISTNENEENIIKSSQLTVPSTDINLEKESIKINAEVQDQNKTKTDIPTATNSRLTSVRTATPTLSIIKKADVNTVRKNVSSTSKKPITIKQQPINKIASIEQHSLVALLASLPTLINKIEFISEQRSLDLTPVKMIKPSKSATKTLFFQLSGGANYSFSNWDTKTNDPFNKDQFDQSVAGHSGMFRIGYSLNRNWDILTGISYTQSVYRYSNQSTNNFIRSENGTVEIIVDEEGNPQPVNGAIGIPVTEFNDIQWHRKHLYLDASLGLRYNKSIAKSWFAHIEGGVFYTIYQNHKGYYRDELLSNKIITFDQGETHPYAASPIGFNTRIGISKEMGPVEIGISSGLRFNPKNQLNNNTIYTLKNSQTDLQLGITFRPGWE